MPRCSKSVEFDAAHRVTRHASKCANLHGHRYKVDVECEALDLDSVGVVVDFGVVKTIFGGWVDEHFDHGTLTCEDDRDLVALCVAKGWKHHVLLGEPTAENIARFLFDKGNELLATERLRVSSVRVHETPSCWAEYP